MSSEAQKALDKIKVRFMDNLDTLFYTSVFFSLNHIWTSDHKTAATDGKTIYINPDYFLSLTSDQRFGLILHEVEHVTGMDMLRGLGKNHDRWNQAADHVINLGLLERGFTLPKGGLHDPQYMGLAKEQVYELLPETEEPYDGDVIYLPEGGNPDEDGPAGPQTDPKALQDHIDEILIRASVQVQMAGLDPAAIPGHVRVRLDQLLAPKLPWYRLLKKYASAAVKHDYTYRKPSRRQISELIVPTLYSDGMGCITVAMDMSGSVTDHQSTVFASETFAIMKQLRPKKVDLVQFDTDIKSIHPLTDASQLRKVTYTGRGGTCLHSLMQWAKKNKPTVMIVFTDGYFYTDFINPGVPVIWAIHSNATFEAPFGKVVTFDIT